MMHISRGVRAWARLRIDLNCGLRRGAWYRVIRLSKDDAFLDVHHEPTRVPRNYVQTMFARPLRWSVVPRPTDAENLPSDWGARYAVCPVCSARARFEGHPDDITCPGCSRAFPVAWNERYLRRRQ